jgi:flavin reductase
MLHVQPGTFDAGLRDGFISAMRGVAASVTVVTTDGPGGRQGATVSAFSSVSADPPVVLVCLLAASRIAACVRTNGLFAVNVLPSGAGAMADRFAGRDDDRIGDRFSGIDCYGKSGNAPRIDGATVFDCTVASAVRTGSHLVIIGQVRDVFDGGRPPLLYRDGQYHRAIPEGRP